MLLRSFANHVSLDNHNKELKKQALFNAVHCINLSSMHQSQSTWTYRTLHSEILKAFLYFRARQYHLGNPWLHSSSHPSLHQIEQAAYYSYHPEILRLSSCFGWRKVLNPWKKPPPASHCCPPRQPLRPFKSQVTSEEVPSHGMSKQYDTGMRLVTLDMQSKC